MSNEAPKDECNSYLEHSEAHRGEEVTEPVETKIGTPKLDERDNRDKDDDDDVPKRAFVTPSENDPDSPDKSKVVLGHFQQWDELTDCGLELLEWYQATGDEIFLQESVACLRSALSICVQGIGDVALTFHTLGIALTTCFERYGDLSELDEAIVKHQSALHLTPTDHPSRLMVLNNLVNALKIRFEQIGDRSDLDHIIVNYQSALELRPPGHPNRWITLNNLANAIMTRFEQFGDRADLGQAIINHQSAVDLTPPGHPNRSKTLNNLASALMTRFEQIGDRADLNQAILNHQSAMELTTPDDPDRPKTLHNFANDLMTRFEQVGDCTDLDGAIVNYQSALELRPPGRPDSSTTLDNLAGALLTRFKQFGNRADLDQAIINFQSAMELTPWGHTNCSMTLNNLANALLTRFEQFGDRADLDRAIVNYQTAVDLTPPSHPDRSKSLNNLAGALLTRFEQVGDSADLNQAIVNHQNAMELTPPGHPHRSEVLNILAGALLTRFDQLGDRVDLDKAIVNHQRALELKSPGHPNRTTTLDNLAGALLIRFQQTKDRADLYQAIAHHQSALELRSPGHPKRTTTLNNLANALMTRFEQFGDRADLDQAIINFQSAMELAPSGHLNRSVTLNNFANALMTRFEQIGYRANLDQAIVNYQSAVELSPPGHPDRSRGLYNLAQCLHTHLEWMSAGLAGDPSIFLFSVTDCQVQIINLLREGTYPSTGGPLSRRLQSALFWADLAMKWSEPSAVNAYQTSLSLLEMLIASGRTLESRHLSLTSARVQRTRTLAVDGAACAIISGQITTALEMLEQGRGVLLAQAGRYRTRADDLEDIHPDLAVEFRRISAEMETSVMALRPSAFEDASDPMTNDAIATYQRLSQEWDDVLRQIRTLDGFSSFLQPTPFLRLREAAERGPVIVINFSISRSDAIIVLPNDDPRWVPLPDATPQLIADLSKQAHPKTSHASFVWLLLSIWRVIVQPVVKVLRDDLQLPKGSRIWWCPTGAITHLPLHAAGDYTQGGENLPNIYISSYTTTLNSLIRARELETRCVTGDTGLLVVGQADVPGLTPLESVQHEVDCLKDLLPSSMVLEGVNTTREAVMNGMAKHEWLHLSCHGHVNQKEPFNSHFSIMDGPLTLSEIVKRGLPKADIAFLSACHSAAGNRDRSDEALHLVAGLQFAGYRSVVGTLWEMADSTGAIATKEFWSTIQKLHMEGKDGAAMSAKALHRAVNALRRASPRVDIVDWACFVHYGC